MKEAIQCIAHIKGNTEKGNHFTFVAIDPFSSLIFECPDNLSFHTEPDIYYGNNEEQILKIGDLMDNKIPSSVKYETLSPFMIH